MEQLAAEPGMFQIPGDETGAAGFMETWTRTLREQTRAASGALERAGGRERQGVCLRHLIWRFCATIRRPVGSHEGARLMEYVNLDAQVGDLSGVLDPSRYLE
ncbi:hypothetical protein ACIQPS_33355 [Streptomyces sp. NPDC091290]|uniref:hypothetical protein n=1 Tax=Streptomyces sp. NPDC091290 TaxID=3365990 RepID=UPI003800D88B